ncbi:mitochondrial import inner membrane translocase subunit TIM44-like [Clytia hemisphaerica]|uniref:Tim44-like domain-containing protein n=1 Tax=Clytia hemisphaerica TaxID=252671 RepID=A0A7M5XKQ4_9CNID
MHKVKENISPYVEKVEQTVQDSQKTFEKVYKDAKESDIYKKSQKVSEELGKTAKETAEKISKTTEGVEDTQSYKTASQAFSAVREDLFDDIAKESRPYQRPEKLRRRSNENEKVKEAKQFEANEDAQDVVLHKDSKWQEQWKDFRDNNPVVTGLFSLKTKYDESDNVMVRATRVVTDKLQDVFMDVFSQSEQAQTLTEISKIDPSFNKENFLKECEFEIIPTVLEAFLRGDLDILQDWCHEGVSF